VINAPDKTIIDELLEEQRMLTAVVRFAQKHERAQVPVQSRFYRDLLPLSKPQAGEQYAFEVDLDKCSGCKACVTACHSLNGLEDQESWRSVGLLVGNDSVLPFQQTITTACHHCVEPACADGCPVLAYEKDPETGIVRHLDDQCIGCQYCVMKCPYEVPRYSARLGIVRKCDMCSNRLSAGEAPACVQSCPSRAIRISVIEKNAVKEDYNDEADANLFLPASPEPSYTFPSTRYTSSRGLPAELKAGDQSEINPADSHWPLIWMLVLTQLSAGGFLINLMLAPFSGEQAPSRMLNIVSALFAMCGLVASIFHLGRPLQAWRAFLGLKRSWLSREIVVLGSFGVVATLILAAEVCSFFNLPTPRMLPLVAAASLSGLAGVFASAMVYHDTHREFWNWKRTFPRFFGTSLVLGAALATAFTHSVVPVVVLLISSTAKLLSELSILRHYTDSPKTALHRTAWLLRQKLTQPFLFRNITLPLFGILTPALLLLLGKPHETFGLVLFTVLLGSELAERYLFFRSVAQPKMPGGVS
jgi:formate dehydrogenase iron-sulfur subunit